MMKSCASSLWLRMRLGNYVKTVHKRHLHYPLPWPKIDHRSKAKNFFALTIGKSFLRVASSRWSEKEFLAGVEIAIKEFANVLHTPELYEELKNITSEELHSCIKNSLDKIQPTWTLELQVHGISNLAVSDVRVIAGMAPDGKEHVMEILGHRVITSQEKMDNILKETGGMSGLTLQHMRSIGSESFDQRVEFQIEVTFDMTESYWLTNEDGAIVEGSKDHTTKSNHKWTFGSEFNRTADYPFSWIITNINNFITTKRVKFSDLL